MTHEFEARRVECPHCHARRGFAPLRGLAGCGYCHACGYTVTPAYEKTGEAEAAPPVKKLLPAEEAEQMLSPLIKRSLKYLEANDPAVNSFGLILAKLTSIETLRSWRVGLEAGGIVTHWMADADGRIINGKRMRYDGFERTGDVEFLLRTKDGGSQVLYGLHQLKRKGTIVLVESEKTAIVASHFFPGTIWLAAGGCTGISKEKAAPLACRHILIAFDLDEAGMKGAKFCGDRLRDAGALPKILNIRNMFPGKPDGYDYADWLMARSSAE